MNKLFTILLACVWVTTTATENMEKTVLQWKSLILKKDLTCTLHFPANGADSLNPIVVYLKNLPSDRVGQESDDVLLSDFLSHGMAVMVVDYERNSKAVAPELLLDIDGLYGFVSGTMQDRIDKDWIYILPEGYTMRRNIPVCSTGTQQVCMDVFYPSGKEKQVPAILQVSSTQVPDKRINQRAYYVYGFLTTGYAGAIMDWSFGGIGAIIKDKIFPEKRAARILRANAKEWNLSGMVGITGHSKGASRAAIAAFIDEEESGGQFQAVLLSAGRYDKEHALEDGMTDEPNEEGTDEELRRVSTVNYLTINAPPIFLSIGSLDKPYRIKQMQRVVQRCSSLGLDYRFIFQEGLAHSYNPEPKVIGEIFYFFDKYLKYKDTEPAIRLKRLPGNPVISSKAFPALFRSEKGNNINGPSLIRLPDDLPVNKRVHPSARYYLYFGHHGGEDIRLAWSASVGGPYTIVNPKHGVLSLRLPTTMNVDGRMLLFLSDSLSFGGHVASPDVHWDADGQRFIMFFHAYAFVPDDNGHWQKDNEQNTFVAYSANGLDFNGNVAPRVIGPSYMRIFDYRNIRFASVMGTFMVSSNSKDWFASFRPCNSRISYLDKARHTAIRVAAGKITVFFTRKEDVPERLFAGRIRIDESSMTFSPDGSPIEILRPGEVWEGGHLPVIPSRSGKAETAVNQLRDPAWFRDIDGREYLLYSVAGEQGIAIAQFK